MYATNINNTSSDNESVDFEFFENQGQQIKYPKKGKDRSKIVTKAVIETHPVMSEKDMLNIKDLKPKACGKTMLNKTSLKNCLAYADEAVQGRSFDSITFDDRECSDNSISDSTLTTITSDLTSVSPCSSITDSIPSLEESGEPVDDCIESSPNGDVNKDDEPCSLEKTENILFDQKVEDDPEGNSLYCSKSDDIYEFLGEDRPQSELVFQQESDTSLLGEELRHISLSNQSSPTSSNLPRSSFCKGATKTITRRKESNLTFNREELMKIERDNLILLKKIMAHSKPRTVSLNYPFTHKKTSAAINRARQQKKIEQDNYVLYSKISAVGRTKKVF